MTIHEKDYFSTVAQDYATFRPQYPKALFKYLNSLCESHDLALDCATGNGQSAIELTDYFQRVIATDISQKQLNQAVPHKLISYQVAPAENIPVQNQSLDLITVAQALHWFDLDKFYTEVFRTLKPMGIIAVWTYNLLTFNNKELNKLINHYYYDILGQFWTSERKSVEYGYTNLSFPFEKIVTPNFSMKAVWTLEHLIGYLNTWSAGSLYKKNKGSDPIFLILDDLNKIWHSDKKLEKTVTWDLTVLVGRCIKSKI